MVLEDVRLTYEFRVSTKTDQVLPTLKPQYHHSGVARLSKP